MTDENDWIDANGVRWRGTREELEAWKRFKRSKALAFVRHGYSVGWCPDAGRWMDVYLPERPYGRVPEIRASLRLVPGASALVTDGGVISALTITATRTDPNAKAPGQPYRTTRVLYDLDLDADQMWTSPTARRLFRVLLEELR